METIENIAKLIIEKYKSKFQTNAEPICLEVSHPDILIRLYFKGEFNLVKKLNYVLHFLKDYEYNNECLKNLSDYIDFKFGCKTFGWIEIDEVILEYNPFRTKDYIDWKKKGKYKI